MWESAWDTFFADSLPLLMPPHHPVPASVGFPESDCDDALQFADGRIDIAVPLLLGDPSVYRRTLPKPSTSSKPSPPEKSAAPAAVSPEIPMKEEEPVQQVVPPQQQVSCRHSTFLLHRLSRMRHCLDAEGAPQPDEMPALPLADLLSNAAGTITEKLAQGQCPTASQLMEFLGTLTVR